MYIYVYICIYIYICIERRPRTQDVEGVPVSPSKVAQLPVCSVMYVYIYIYIYMSLYIFIYSFIYVLSVRSEGPKQGIAKVDF